MSMVFQKMLSPFALITSFPLAVYCNDTALPLDCEHSQVALLGILKVENNDSGFRLASNLDEMCFYPYAYILIRQGVL